MTLLARERETDPRWYSDKYEDRRHEVILRYVRSLENGQRDIRQRLEDNAYLYHQCQIMGLDREWHIPAFARKYGPSSTNIIEYNVDAVTALIARHKPRIAVLTDRANWSTHKLARQLERWIEAEFKRTRLYDDVTMMFRDAAWAGTGVLHFFKDPDTMRPEVERCLIDEFVVDERECRTTLPRQIHRRKFPDIDQAIALWPDYEVELRKAAERGQYKWTSYQDCPDGHVAIVESWHLPSGPRAGDGRHTIVAHGVTLRDEPWTENWYPFIFFHWSPPITGFYGRGIADILKPKQAAVNKRRRAIARSIDLMAWGKWIIGKADAHIAPLLTNAIAPVIVTNSGKEYKPVVPEKTISSDVYADVQREIDEAAMAVGVSSSTVLGGPVRGTESGAAYRQIADRENGRFSNQAERLENVYVDSAEHLIRIQRDIAGEEDASDREVQWNSGDLSKIIPWSEADPEDMEYVLVLKAASQTARDLSGRIQEVIELAQANALSKEQMLKVLNHPDLQGEYDITTAAVDDIERTIEILEDEEIEYPAPNYLQDLDMGLSRVHARYLRIKGMNPPEVITQRFIDWLVDAQDESDRAKAESAMRAAQALQAAQMKYPGGGQPLGDPSSNPNASAMNAAGGLPDAALRMSPEAQQQVTQ